MLVLITYDVCTTDPAGRSRLRKVSKYCVKYGQRVQNSVFECLLDEAQYKLVQHQLLKMIDDQQDSLRFYRLGNSFTDKVDHFGVKMAYNPEECMLV